MSKQKPTGSRAAAKRSAEWLNARQRERDEVERRDLQAMIKEIAARLEAFHQGTKDDIWKQFEGVADDVDATLAEVKQTLSDFFSSWSEKERAAIFDGWTPSRKPPRPEIEELATRASFRDAQWALALSACTRNREGQFLASRIPIRRFNGGPVTLLIEVGTQLDDVMEALMYFDYLIPRQWSGLIADPPEDGASVEGGPSCLRERPVRSISVAFRDRLRACEEIANKS